MPPIPKPKRKRTTHFIRAWRKHRDLTQEQVAARLNIAASTFGRVERGKVPYDQDFLEMTADALQCKPWDLLHRDPTKDGDVIDLMAKLDDNGRKEAADYLRYLASRKTSSASLSFRLVAVHRMHFLVDTNMHAMQLSLSATPDGDDRCWDCF